MKTLSPSSPHLKLNPPEAAAGCLSGILRRLLCGNVSDGRGDADLAVRNRERSVEEKTPQSPGIVARLMGLETMPNSSSAASADSIGRSRSTNSAESWPGFLNERYRSSQIKTSASFREVPTYLTRENEEFLLLSFGPEDKGEKKKKKKESREQKSSRRREESKTTRKWSADGKIDDSTPLLVCKRKGLESAQREEVVVLEAECVTQNSSPVSVLDHADGDVGDDDECDALPKSTTLEEVNPPTKQQSSRRKLSSNFESFDCAFPPIQSDEGSRKADERRERSSKHERVFPDVTDIWGQICGLIEKDLRNTTWVLGELRSEEGGEDDVVAEIGSELLDLLLNEATLELFKNMVYV